MSYMKLVDRDWGGNDVKDHLEGLKHIEKDPRSIPNVERLSDDLTAAS